MTQSDDKRRGAGIREASKLRAVLGSEPSSGYAFHDQVRVDRVERMRTPRPDAHLSQTASHAPRERSFAQTLMGSATAQDFLAARTKPDRADDSHDESSRKSLPPVPSDLAGSGDDSQVKARKRPSLEPEALSEDALELEHPQSVPAAGGAIWQALPSLVDRPESDAPTDVSDPPSDAPELSVAEELRASRPVGYRPWAAELEAEHRHAYGDPRLLKYEALVERNAWEQISDELSRETSLSPALCLLHIVARRESLRSDQKLEATRLTEQAIATVARILHVPEASPTALVIGKRLLRKNPGSKYQKPASARLSASIMLFGIAAGTGIGWLVTKLLL